MMRYKALLTFLVAALAVSWTLHANDDKTGGKAAEKPPAAHPQRLDELIKLLGSSKFAERNAAKKELEALGMSALEALRRAAKSKDLETSRRAGELVQKLEAKLTNEAMLAPKRVHLKLKDTPVLDAVAELGKQSGYPIQVMGDRTGLADKRITLDTGETTFWQALDQLCRAAGLTETAPANQPQAQPAFPALPAVPALPLQPGQRIRQPQQAPGILPVVPPKAPAIPQIFQVQGQAQAAPGQAQPAPAQGPRAQFVPAQPLPVQAPPLPAPPQIQLVFPAQQAQFFPVAGNAAPDNRGPITLTAGKPAEVPTSYAGAVRVRLSTQPTPPAPAGEVVLTLDVAAEPRLHNFRIAGTPRIDKAIDDQDQSLMIAMEPNAGQPQANPAAVGNVVVWGAMPAEPVAQRFVNVRLKRGEKEAKRLKELSGTLTAQATTQSEALASIDNILKAAGKTAKGKDGGSLQVQSVDKLDNGDIQVKVVMENLGKNPFGAVGAVGGGRIMIQGQGVVQFRQIQIGNGGGVMIGGARGNSANMPKLLDAKGQAYQVVNIPEQSMQFNNGQSTTQCTIIYRAQPGQGEPTQLALYGERQISFQVPFTLKDVPLR